MKIFLNSLKKINFYFVIYCWQSLTIFVMASKILLIKSLISIPVQGLLLGPDVQIDVGFCPGKRFLSISLPCDMKVLSSISDITA